MISSYRLSQLDSSAENKTDDTLLVAAISMFANHHGANVGGADYVLPPTSIVPNTINYGFPANSNPPIHVDYRFPANSNPPIHVDYRFPANSNPPIHVGFEALNIQDNVIPKKKPPTKFTAVPSLPTKINVQKRLLHNYKDFRPLATGGTADIYLATDIRTGLKRCLKTKLNCKLIELELEERARESLAAGVSLRNGKSYNEQVLLQAKTEALAREIAFLELLDHPNIIKMCEVLKEGQNEIIVLEYCRGGNFLGLIEKRKGPLVEEYLASVMKQIFQAVQYLHSRNIVHKDLKLENIVLDKSRQHIKIIDFGMSELCDMDTCTEEIYPPTYNIAPEVATEQYKQTVQCDIWSLGLLLHELATGQTPFDAENPSEFINSERELVLNKIGHLNPELQDLIRNMLIRDPSKRLNIRQCLEHPWMKNATMENVPEDSIIYVKKILNLKLNTKRKSLHTLVLNAVAKKVDYSTPEMRLIAAVFKSIDTDGNGLLSMYELGAFFGGNCDPGQLIKLMNMIVTTNGGSVSMTEFTAALFPWVVNEEMLKAAFKSIDINGDGMLSVQHLKYITKHSIVVPEKYDDFGYNDFIELISYSMQIVK